MSLGGLAPPGPAGGAYSTPTDSLAALKLPHALGARSSAPTAPRLMLRRSETGRSGSSFFPFEHCVSVIIFEIFDVEF